MWHAINLCVQALNNPAHSEKQPAEQNGGNDFDGQPAKYLHPVDHLIRVVRNGIHCCNWSTDDAEQLVRENQAEQTPDGSQNNEHGWSPRVLACIEFDMIIGYANCICFERQKKPASRAGFLDCRQRSIHHSLWFLRPEFGGGRKSEIGRIAAQASSSDTR